MSDTTNRQAYVFLDTSINSTDMTIEGDEMLFDDEWHDAPIGQLAKWYKCVRRPITLPNEQTDKLKVWDEYAKSALTGLCANPIHATTNSDIIASWAKQQADTMMKARAGK